MNDYEDAMIDAQAAAMDAGDYRPEDLVEGWNDFYTRLIADYDDDDASECPFCGHPVDVLTGAVVCTNCEVTWATAADMATDAANLAAEGWAR